MAVEIMTGRYSRILVRLGSVSHVLTLAETMELQAELAQAMLSIAHELAKRAVQNAIDGALGEVARQTGGGQDQVMREAVSAGHMAARAHLDAIPKPMQEPSD